MKKRKFIALTISLIIVFAMFLLFNYFLLPYPSLSSNFLILTSSSTVLLISLLLITYYSYVTSDREKIYEKMQKMPEGLKEELKRLYQVLVECEGKYYTLRRTFYKVFGHIEKILRNYKRELSLVPRDLISPFYEIYKSIEGKHGHYNEKRLKTNLRHLRKSLDELLSHSI